MLGPSPIKQCLIMFLKISNISFQFLRLGFHDCLKYRDGAPTNGFDGCDGCLNRHLMLNLANHDKTWKHSDVRYTSNTGLLSTADYLEAVYTNNTFPEKIQFADDKTMKEKNYSRADLWAFATMVAYEDAVKKNNLACSGELKGEGGMKAIQYSLACLLDQYTLLKGAQQAQMGYQP